MAETKLRVSQEFVDGVATIYTEKLLARVEQALRMLEENAEIGSPNVRKSLTDSFGQGIRKLVIAPFVLVYRYQGETIDVFALVYGKRIV